MMRIKKEIDVIVENKLVLEKRDMNIYHHHSGSAHMISYNSSITLPLRSRQEDDYLHISIVSGPGRLQQSCIVDLPEYVNFQFSNAKDVTISHQDERTNLQIPPGPPDWQLKLTLGDKKIKSPTARVIVGDDLFLKP